MTKQVNIVGSHGLYASYGGWDQLVINLAELKSDQIDYLIFNPKETPITEKLDGVSVKQLPLSGSGAQGLIFDSLSILSSFSADVILMLGMKAMPVALCLKIIRPKLKLIINIGGIEWERPQFNPLFKFYLQFCFYLAKKVSNHLVIDNEHYQDFFDDTHSRRVTKISYGGIIDKSLHKTEVRSEFDFIDTDYYLSISRSIVDNKLQELCDLFSNLPSENLVLISNFSNSGYGRDVFNRYNSYPNIKLIDGLYEKPKLDIVRRSCRAYIHTHTLCGSAPSLIEMIVCRVPIYSIDVAQNRHTLADQGYYFGDFSDLKVMLEGGQLPNIPSLDFAGLYDWHSVVSEYERLVLEDAAV
jgi:hypothetical protein